MSQSVNVTQTDGSTIRVTIAGGSTGAGVPAGGSDGQILVKTSDTVNYSTAWKDSNMVIDTAGATLNADTDVSGNGYVIDEDNMASDSATKLPTQQSVKAYADERVTSDLLGGVPYRPPNAGTFFDKLDAARTTPVDILIFGDSISVRGNPTDERPWTMLLSDYLNKHIYGSVNADSRGPVGFVFPAVSGSGYEAHADDTTGTYSGAGFSGHSVTLTDGQYVRHNAYCDRIMIVYRESGVGGDLIVRDGGPSGTILTTIDSNGGGGYGQTWTSDDLGAGEHDIYLECDTSGGGSNVIVEGIYFYLNNYDKGIRIWPACKAGANSSTSQTASWLTFAQTTDPDLMIFATGVNDYANYDSYMRAQIDYWTGYFPNADRALWNPYYLPISDRWIEANATLARAIASDYDMLLVDAFTAIPDISRYNSGLLIDGTHPTPDGSVLIAQHMNLLLSGDPMGSLLANASVGMATKNFVNENSIPTSGGLSVRDQHLSALYDDLDALQNGSSTDPVDIVVIADSIGQIGDWPAKLYEQLATIYNSTASSTTVIPTVPFKHAYAGTFGLQTMDTTQGTNTNSAFGGWGKTLSDGQYCEDTETCDGVFVVWGENTGTLTVKDGGSGGSTVATIDTSTGDGGGNITSIDLSSYASHTIYIESTGDTTLEGILPTVGNRTGGVRVWNGAHTGYTSNHFTSDTTTALDFIEKIKALTDKQPHVIIATGFNDGDSNYSTYMPALIEAVQAVTRGSCILWSAWQRDSWVSNRLTLARDYASEYRIGLVDASKVFGNIGQRSDANSLSNDGAHPNSTGAWIVAFHFLAVITGDAIGSTLKLLAGVDEFFEFRGNAASATTADSADTAAELDYNQTTAGRIRTTNLFGYPIVEVLDASDDANQALVFANKAIINALGITPTATSGGIFLGPGGASALDLYLYENEAGSLYSSGAMVGHAKINAQSGTTYTTVLTDDGKTVTLTNAAAITLTVPANATVAYPVGTKIDLVQLGAGQVTVAGAGGVTVNATPGLKLRDQYSGATLSKIATNTWVLFGDLTA